MTIRSHPQPDTLISYASGALPCAIAGVVACHVSVCERCRADLRRLELIGGLLLERQPTHGEAEAAEALAERRILAHKFAPAMLDAAPAPVEPDDPLLPSPLVRYLGMGSDEIPWKTLPKGVKQYWVDMPKGAGLMRLLKVPPHTRLLEHSHHGQEVTMVLKGVYSDYTGDYVPGDVCEMHEGMEHRPAGSSDEECVCIVASEYAPHYSRWYARLLRPLLGF
jgi:putative transcriptional regulator